jgi:hypothetical protein
MKRLLFASVALAPMVPVGASAAPKNDNAIVKSSKKPGKTCRTLAPGSSARKDCVQTFAHTGQTDKGKGQAKKF